MAKEKKTKTSTEPKGRYELFYRFWAGLIVLACIITVVGGTVAGASADAIIKRCVVVFFVLGIAGRILIRSWASWEELKRGEIETRRR